MDMWIGRLTLLILAVYVVVSFFSALRMYFVHNYYVHVEFAGKKWRSFGTWAPKQYRRLKFLRTAAILMIFVWLSWIFVAIYKQ
jgi:type VI protein secretion system component VasK